MVILQQVSSLVLHLDDHLLTFISLYGPWVYAILFLVIFCETGLVVTPFLPGDSLLFAAGALAAHAEGGLNIHLLFALLVIASIIGNGLNYLIGKFIGPKIFYSNDSLFFNRKYLEKAHRFYEVYGGKTIIIARFLPIIRTFAPFVAGIGYMGYRQFFIYNVAGAILWVGSLLYISYLFGNLPFIKDHFSLLVIGIIGFSLIPPMLEIIRQCYIKKAT